MNLEEINLHNSVSSCPLPNISVHSWCSPLDFEHFSNFSLQSALCALDHFEALPIFIMRHLLTKHIGARKIRSPTRHLQPSFFSFAARLSGLLACLATATFFFFFFLVPPWRPRFFLYFQLLCFSVIYSETQKPLFHASSVRVRHRGYASTGITALCAHLYDV